MSAETCPHCHGSLTGRSNHCPGCGLPLRASTGRTPNSAGIHPFAPFVFIAAGVAAGLAATLFVGLAVAAPLALFGGGIGVWMLERGRRLR
jgi:hypothetical protein